MNFEVFLLKKEVRIFLISVILGAVLTSFFCAYSNSVMADITENVLRFHIMANSDSYDDQRLKIIVRDDILKFLSPVLEDAKNKEDAAEKISENMETIKRVALESIKKHGYAYGVTAKLEMSKFPTKEYEDIKLPCGYYDALNITIGDGNGHNWWCMLYPKLCFSPVKEGKITDKERQKLKNVLTDDEYAMITKNGADLKLKIVEIFSD